MKEILTIVMIISFLISLSPVYACVSMPEAKLTEECSNYGTIYVPSNFENKTTIIERLQQYKNYNYPCGTISLTDNDVEIIADFLSNGYSVLKQTQEEYQSFLKNANEVNNNLSTCDYYSAVAYRDGWVGYSFSDESDKTQACVQAPRRLCGGGSINVLWNDLSPISMTTSILVSLLNYWWLFIIVIIIVLIGIIYKSKK